MTARITVALLLTIFALCLVPAAFPQQPRVDQLFEQLRSAETTNAAADALLKSAKTNVETRHYLAANLPGMVSTGWKGCYPQWRNAVRLAGELRIAEAAPALEKWISLDNVGETSAGAYERLETNPAGKALAQIGDPAIPVLVDVLHNGSVRERKNAYLVLYEIDSTLAKSTIRGESGRETDPTLREFAKRIVDSETPQTKQ